MTLAAPPELVERRRGMAEALAKGMWRTDPPARDAALGGVRVLHFRPAKPARGVILHLHGGAFRIGCPETVGPYAVALAERCAVEVVCPAYRLAPEHPFPAGLDDARAVLQALKAESDLPLILSGDSAGGNLAAALAAEQRVAGLVLLSAWLDLTVTSPSYAANAATDPLFSREAAEEASALYLQGARAEQPSASPLLGPVDGFPPTLVSVGLGEVLAEDGLRFHAALQAAGVPARLCAIAGMEHTAVVRGLDKPGSPETFEAVAAFVDEVVSKPRRRPRT